MPYLALASVAACAVTPPPPPRNDIAVVEAGDARIEKIDGIQIRSGNDWAFELRPGGHTVEISSVWIRPHFGVLPIQVNTLTSLCIKARAGHRYRIKYASIDGRHRVFFIDTATGEPPKTPCGPDEEDD